jgi:hypothetical protein
MTDQDNTAKARVADGINVGLGVWLIMSPWIYDFDRYAVTNADVSRSTVLVGVVIAICSAIRFAYPHRGTGPSGFSVVLGFWTGISPWFYGFTTNVAWLWTSVIAGVAVIALAVCSVRQTHPERSHQQQA